MNPLLVLNYQLQNLLTLKTWLVTEAVVKIFRPNMVETQDSFLDMARDLIIKGNYFTIYFFQPLSFKDIFSLFVSQQILLIWSKLRESSTKV